MPCHPINERGVSGFACSRGRRKPALCPCGSGIRASRLCDFILSHNQGIRNQRGGFPAGNTCDAPLCDRCATKVGPNQDLCKEHADAGVKATIAVLLKPARNDKDGEKK